MNSKTASSDWKKTWAASRNRRPGHHLRAQHVEKDGTALYREICQRDLAMIRLASGTASAIAATCAGEFLGTAANFLAARIDARKAKIANFLGSSTSGTIACFVFLFAIVAVNGGDGMPFASKLLNRIVAFYLDSHDFNGIRANEILEDSGTGALETLKKLVAKGLVDVYSSAHDNPHIKRLPALSIPQQLGCLDAAGGEEQVCLFPSIRTMRQKLPSNKYRTKPFSRFLALGHPQLELLTVC